MRVTYLVLFAGGAYRVCQSNDCSKGQKKLSVAEYGCNLAASLMADKLNNVKTELKNATYN